MTVSPQPSKAVAGKTKGHSSLLRTAAMNASVIWTERLNRRNRPLCCLAAMNSSMSG